MGSPTQDMALNGTQLTQGDALFDSLLLTARQGGPSKRGAVEEPDAHRDPKAARRQQQEGQALLAQHGSFTHQQGEDREGTSAGSDASHLNEPVHDQGHTGAEEPGHDDGATATQQEEAATLTPTLQEVRGSVWSSEVAARTACIKQHAQHARPGVSAFRSCRVTQTWSCACRR